MPRADPIVNKGVFKRREKITIDALTATRRHRHQRINRNYSDEAKARRFISGSVIAPQAPLCTSRSLLILPHSIDGDHSRPEQQQQRQ